MLIFSRGFLRKDELGVFCYIREGRGRLQERKSCGWAQPGMNSSRARSCEQGATADGISTSSPFCLGEELLSKLIMFVWESKKRSEIQNQESLKRKRLLKDKNISFHFYFFLIFGIIVASERENCSIPWDGGKGEVRERGRKEGVHSCMEDWSVGGGLTFPSLHSFPLPENHPPADQILVWQKCLAWHYKTVATQVFQGNTEQYPYGNLLKTLLKDRIVCSHIFQH